jgi:hypothetical protein
MTFDCAGLALLAVSLIGGCALLYLFDHHHHT